MSQGDAMRLLILIKQKEQYIARLRLVLDQAKKEQAPDVFSINAEMRTQITEGRLLVDRYNEIARLQKEDREFLIANARREEQIALKTIRHNLKRHIPSKQEAKDD